MKKVKEKNRTSTEINGSIIKGLNQALVHAKGNKLSVVEHKMSILPLTSYKKNEIKVIRKNK